LLSIRGNLSNASPSKETNDRPHDLHRRYIYYLIGYFQWSRFFDHLHTAIDCYPHTHSMLGDRPVGHTDESCLDRFPPIQPFASFSLGYGYVVFNAQQKRSDIVLIMMEASSLGRVSTAPYPEYLIYAWSHIAPPPLISGPWIGSPSS
jgi:hypothetical protein